MKVPALFVPVCLFFFVFGPACSREDQPAELVTSPKVVQTIEPLQEPKDASDEEAEQKPEQSGEEKSGQGQDKPPAGTMGLEVKEPSGAENAQAPAGDKSKTQAKADQGETGVYIVTTGDSLAGIAARQEIMQDPLKWLILLQLNLDRLREQPIGADFAVRELKRGMKLRFITPLEAAERVEKPSPPMWIVNVMSGSTMGEIASPSVILVREGYQAYITRANVKGKDYLRLRVGFFPSKSMAGEQGEKIKKLLGFEEFWATRINTMEYEEVAGFFKAPEIP